MAGTKQGLILRRPTPHARPPPLLKLCNGVMDNCTPTPSTRALFMFTFMMPNALVVFEENHIIEVQWI